MSSGGTDQLLAGGAISVFLSSVALAIWWIERRRRRREYLEGLRRAARRISEEENKP